MAGFEPDPRAAHVLTGLCCPTLAQLMEQQKKLLLVGFAVFIRPGSVAQLMFGLIVALLHFFMHVECRAFVHDSDDSLAGVFSFVVLFTYRAH